MNSANFIGVEHDRLDRKELYHTAVYGPDEVRHSTKSRVGGAPVVSTDWPLEGLEPLIFYQIIVENFDGHIPGLRLASQGLIDAPRLLCLAHIVDGSI